MSDTFSGGDDPGSGAPRVSMSLRNMPSAGYVFAPYVPMQVVPFFESEEERYIHWLAYHDRFTPKGGNGDPVSWSGDRRCQATELPEVPEEFPFRKGLRTRYSAKQVHPNFYGTLKVTGL